MNYPGNPAYCIEHKYAGLAVHVNFFIHRTLLVNLLNYFIFNGTLKVKKLNHQPLLEAISKLKNSHEPVYNWACTRLNGDVFLS
jgi:hypothetical protein